MLLLSFSGTPCSSLQVTGNMLFVVVMTHDIVAKFCLLLF